jgi:hypothetical protein
LGIVNAAGKRIEHVRERNKLRNYAGVKVSIRQKSSLKLFFSQSEGESEFSWQ